MGREGGREEGRRELDGYNFLHSLSTLSFAAFQDIQDSFNCDSVVRDLSIWWQFTSLLVVSLPFPPLSLSVSLSPQFP